MILVHNDATKRRLAECFAHALDLDIVDNFLSQLQYLSTYAQTDEYAWQPQTKTEFFYDFADWSLGFVTTYFRRDVGGRGSDGELTDWSERVMRGGLIFHPGATGVDTSLSVDLSSNDKPHWSIHT